MAYTEVRHESWGKRTASSVLMALFGLLLLVGGCVLLFWNEGRAVKTAQALEEGESLVRTVTDPSQVDELREGKLVHMKGCATTEAVLRDPEFGLVVPGIRMERKVEYYQWVEEEESHTETEMGGDTTTVTTYRYHKKWCDEPVSSATFKEAGHENSVAWRPQEEQAQWLAERVTLGAYELNPGQVERVGTAKLIDPYAHARELDPLGACILWMNECVHVNKEKNDADYLNPKIGTVRVTWYAVPQQQNVSLVAQQRGRSFEPYTAESSGYEVDLLYDGLLSSEQVFEKAYADNTFLTWVLRAGGAWLVFAGLLCVTNIIPVLGSVVPLMGRLLGYGAFLASLIGAGLISLFTIALAWFWYRPLLSLTLVCLACLPWLWKRWRGKK